MLARCPDVLASHLSNADLEATVQEASQSDSSRAKAHATLTAPGPTNQGDVRAAEVIHQLLDPGVLISALAIAPAIDAGETSIAATALVRALAFADDSGGVGQYELQA